MSYFHVRIPARDPDLKPAVERAALHDHMSPSDWIRRALRQAIDRQHEEMSTHVNPHAHLSEEIAPMAKQPSRPDRWAEACRKALESLADVRVALEELDEVRQEYEEWRDNMPENMQTTATYEKLEEIADLDILSPLDDVESAIEDFAAADLPVGFGQD